MARRSTTLAEPRAQRSYTLAFPTVAALEAAHAHSKRVKLPLAELIRNLIEADIKAHGALPSGE